MRHLDSQWRLSIGWWLLVIVEASVVWRSCLSRIKQRDSVKEAIMRRVVSAYIIPRRVMGLAIALVLLAACGPAATPTPTAPMPEPGAEWDYVALGDSTPDCFGVMPKECYVNLYAEHIERDLGVKVMVHNCARGGSGFSDILDALRKNQELRDTISEAEVITIWAFWLNDLAGEYSLYNAGLDCGGDDNLDCIREAIPAVKADFDAVVAELLSLRSGSPTIIRIANVGNPFVAEWKEQGRFEHLERLLIDDVVKHMAQSASKHDIPIVDSYLVLNGPNGDQPVDKGYMQADGVHFNAEGHALLADLHREVGYAPFGP